MLWAIERKVPQSHEGKKSQDLISPQGLSLSYRWFDEKFDTSKLISKSVLRASVLWSFYLVTAEIREFVMEFILFVLIIVPIFLILFVVWGLDQKRRQYIDDEEMRDPRGENWEESLKLLKWKPARLTPCWNSYETDWFNDSIQLFLAQTDSELYLS